MKPVLNDDKQILSNFKNNRKENQRGITLIVLVITIILIIILAGISANLVFGENGIIKKTQSAQEKSNIARISEKLEIEKTNVGVYKNNIVKLEDYMEQIKGKGIITDEDVTPIGSIQSIIVVEGKYHFLLEENNGNLEITYMGTAKTIKPMILNVDLSNTTNSITAKVNTVYAEGGTYRFLIKDNEAGEYEEKLNQLGSEYTYLSLEENKKYYIKIEVTGTNGESSSIELIRLTTNITFTYTPSEWTNQNVTVTVNTSALSEYTLQTSKDGINWETKNTQTYSQNGPVYVRIVDNKNQMNGNILGNVDNIDKSIPDDATVLISGDKVQTTSTVTLSATVTHNDNEIDISKCKYIYNTTSAQIGTAESDYTQGTFSANGQTIQLNNMTDGTYYLHILTTDKANNKKETIKGPIQITQNTHTHTGDSTVSGGCYGAANMVSVPYQSYEAIGGHMEGHQYQGNESYYNYCEICGVYWDHHSSPTYVTDYGYVTRYRSEQKGWKLNCGKTEGQLESYDITY